jgi:hypothetical protein
MQIRLSNALVVLGLLLLAPTATSAEFDVEYSLSGSIVSYSTAGFLGGQSGTGGMTIRYQGTTGNVVHGPVHLVKKLYLTFNSLSFSSYGDLFTGNLRFWLLPTAVGSLKSTGSLTLVGNANWSGTLHCLGGTCLSFYWPARYGFIRMFPSLPQLNNWSLPVTVRFPAAATPNSNTLLTSFTGNGSGYDYYGGVGPQWNKAPLNTGLTLTGIHAQEVSRVNVHPTVPSLSGPFLALLVGLFMTTGAFWLRRRREQTLWAHLAQGRSGSPHRGAVRL